MLKLTSGKVFLLKDVLHVPSIRQNLVSISLPGKARIKVILGSDLVTLSKNNVFVGKSYLDKSLYVLNVNDMINDNGSSSFAYFVDSSDLWHGRGGYVNFGYLKKMK